MHPCSPNRKKAYDKTYRTPFKISYLTNRIKTFLKCYVFFFFFFFKTMKHQFYQKKLQPTIETWLSYGGMHMILKRLQIVGLPNTKSVSVCVWLGVNIHTCTDWFTGQSFLLKMVCSHRVSLFVSVNSVSTRERAVGVGWFVWVQGLTRGGVPLYQVAFSYPLNQHQDCRI